MSAVTRIASVKRRRMPMRRAISVPARGVPREQLHEQVPRIEAEELARVVAEPGRALERHDRLRDRALARKKMADPEARREIGELTKHGAPCVEAERHRHRGHPGRDHQILRGYGTCPGAGLAHAGERAKRLELAV